MSPSQLCLADEPGVPNTVKGSVEQGCGYLRFIVRDGATGSLFGLVYDQLRGQLVHSWSAPMPCYSVVNIGTMPACSTWSFIPCDRWISRDAGVLDAATD